MSAIPFCWHGKETKYGKGLVLPTGLHWVRSWVTLLAQDDPKTLLIFQICSCMATKPHLISECLIIVILVHLFTSAHSRAKPEV